MNTRTIGLAAIAASLLLTGTTHAVAPGGIPRDPFVSSFPQDSTMPVAVFNNDVYDLYMANSAVEGTPDDTELLDDQQDAIADALWASDWLLATPVWDPYASMYAYLEAEWFNDTAKFNDSQDVDYLYGLQEYSTLMTLLEEINDSEGDPDPEPYLVDLSRPAESQPAIRAESRQ